MTANWVSELLRQTFLNTEKGNDITFWARKLVQAFRENKPDHEMHVLGVSRVPGMPNFLIGSSSEAFLSQGPLPITVTQKTADLFLAPTQPGVRMLNEELPMVVRYDLDESGRRIDLSFYEAICLDSSESSIILALTLPESTVQEFLSPPELAELLPMVRSYAVPLLELFQYRNRHQKMEHDMEAMLMMMRESNPEISKLSGLSFLPNTDRDSNGVEPEFLQYIVRELRALSAGMGQTNERQLELARTSMGSPQLLELCQLLSRQLKATETLLRNVASFAMLSSRDVKPKRGAFAMQALVRDLYAFAMDVGTPHGVRVELQENTRNIYVSGDLETLRGMAERLMRHSIECSRGGNFWIRTEDSSEYCPEGMVMLEFRDNGEVDERVPSMKLVDRVAVAGVDHPRLRRGGAILLQLLDIYMSKSGGRMMLRYNADGGLCVQLMLPQVSRAELDRIKAGEI